MPKTVIKLRKTLQEAATHSDKRPPPNYDLVQSKVTLQSLAINIGDKVVVGGVKVSVLLVYLFCYKTGIFLSKSVKKSKGGGGGGGSP